MTRQERSKKVWAKWRKLVSEQVRSGQSVAVFCRERRLCVPHFFAWKKRLRQAATVRQPQGNEAEQFVEVKRVAAASTAGDSRVEVRLQNGRSLLVGLGFDAQLREKLLAWKEQLLPKHPMAEALNYTLGQWEELNVFCKDGAVPIDNNVSEREMKRVVLNRKNSLFVGNPRGGRTAAILASLTSTCRRHEIDPQRYLTQLLVNLPSWPARDLDAWLPDQWKLRQAARLATLQGSAITDS